MVPLLAAWGSMALACSVAQAPMETRVVPLSSVEHEREGGAWVEFESAATGRIQAWVVPARVAVRLALEGREAAQWLRAEGAGVPFVRGDAQRGESLRIQVQLAPSPDTTPQPALHLVLVVEDPAARAEAEARTAALDALWSASNSAAGLERFDAWLAELHGLELASALFEELIRSAGDAAQEAGLVHRWRDLRQRLVDEWSRTRPGFDPDLLAARLDLAAAHHELGDPRAALAIHESVLLVTEAEAPLLSALRSRARVGRANARHELGDLQGARADLEWVLARPAAETGAEVHSSARENLARVLITAGDFPAARELLESVIAERARRLPVDAQRQALTRGNLALALRGLGLLEEARALQEGVDQELAQRMPANHPARVRTRLGWAIALIDLDRIGEARGLLERALAEAGPALASNSDTRQRLELALAVTLKRLGDLPGARVLEERVVEAWKRTLPPAHPDLIAALENLSITLEGLGELEAARALGEEVLAAREAALPSDHPWLAQSRLNVGVSAYVAGDLDRAQALFEAAVASLERVAAPDDRLLGSARVNLAVVAKHRGRYGLAAEVERRELDARESLLPADHLEVLRIRHNLALTLEWNEELDAARTELRLLAAGLVTRTLSATSLAPREILEVLGTDARRVGQILSLLDAPVEGDRERVVQLVETRRAAATESARVRSLDASDLELAALRQAALRTKSDLIAFASAPGRARVEGRAPELGALVLARDEAERALRAALAGRGAAVEAFDARAAAALLPRDAAAVLYLVYERWRMRRDGVGHEPGPPHLLAHVVRPGLELQRIELGPLEVVRRLAAAWRDVEIAGPARGLAVPTASAAEERESVGRELRRLLIDPVLAAAGPGLSRLIVCADDVLHVLPLDALPLDAADSGRERLGDLLEVSVLPSLARLRGAPPPARSKPRLVALGDVPYAPELALSALPATRAEVELIAARFGARHAEPAVVLTGGAATRTRLAAELAGASHVHIATHGWFADGAGATERLAPWLECGLALAPVSADDPSHGILSAEELSGLDFAHCELAVLSACETNVGRARQGLGIQSLQAALAAAGVRTSITSLWPVEDQAAQELFEVFYERLWGQGEGVGRALWGAKRTLRERGRALSAWAGWVVCGIEAPSGS
ncbi:MAG: CHAT domain-containing protein [Planctomycetes bacterium]|nr:CHAT domain-containing protein [Planctomycetota bacterium]